MTAHCVFNQSPHGASEGGGVGAQGGWMDVNVSKLSISFSKIINLSEKNFV